MSAADQYTGPWISHDRLPPLRREFDYNRDPYLARQMDQEGMSEAERRRAASERASETTTPPQHNLIPPPAMRGASDRAARNAGWLQAEREDAMAQYQQHSKRERPRSREPTR